MKRRLTKRPPDSAELRRLERIPGTSRHYRDPVTGNVYSYRQVQTARAGNLSFEQRGAIKRAGFANLSDAAAHAHGSNTLPYLANRYAAKHGISIAQALKDKNFLKYADKLRKSSEGPSDHKGKPRSMARRKIRARALVELGFIDWEQYELYL